MRLNYRIQTIMGFSFVVKPADRFCTVEYHLYLPTNCQVNTIPFGDWEKVGVLLQQQQIMEVTFREHCKEFCYKKKAPDCLREGQTVQFKHLKDDATNGTSLADRITNKANKLVQYVSAFANHDGGQVYYGINDTTYTVEGQIANVSERRKIEARVLNELSKMIWPIQNSDHVHFWKIDFVPVVQKIFGTSGYEVCHDVFVIVLSVAKCPGGVFAKEPESYQFVNRKAARIPFPLWKDKMLAACGNSDDDHSSHTKRRSKIRAPVVYRSVSATGWSSDKLEKEYMEVAQLMENLRNNGNWYEIDRIAKKVLTPTNTNADMKLAVTFQCTAAAYRQNKHPEAYDFLKSYQSLLKQAENRAIFQVQELYSWSAIKRSERNYQESYKYTYDALQKMQLIVPGWITAWFLCNAASLLTILASEEPDPTRKQELIDESEQYYVQALGHSQTIMAYKKAAANIKHRVHINLAMLYLDSSPKFNSINFIHKTVSPQNLKRAKESLQAAEDFEGAPMTGFNEFHFLLAKTDLCLRYFYQNPDENCEYIQKALKFANNAHKVAKDHDFAEVLHYAQSRLTFLGTIPKEDQKTADLVDMFLKNVSFF